MIIETVAIKPDLPSYGVEIAERIVKRSYRDGEIVRRGFMSETEQMSGPAGTQSSGSVSQPTTTQTSEKMLRQSEVDQLVGSVKHQAYQKGYESARNEWSNQSQSQQQQTQPVFDVEAQRKIIAEELQKARQEEEATRQKTQQEAYGRQVMSELSQKISEAQARIPDFEAVTKQVDFTELPDILELSNHVENAGDVLYELAKNPSKIGNLRNLPPSVAKLEMKKLSDSIKANAQAVNKKMPNDPLQRLEPSNVGVANSGEPSLKDWKDRYRGRI